MTHTVGVPVILSTRLMRFISPMQGCYSYIGMIGGEQIVSLDSGCYNDGIGPAIHEMLHALGMIHEQNRKDRDKYVTIDINKVKPGKQQWIFFPF